jgi:MoxR-like ATPase
VITEDIQAVAKPVLRHRVLMNYAAVSEGIRSDHVIDKIVESLSIPARGSAAD